MPGGLHPPLEVTQSWPAPNYVNPELRSDAILILAYVLGPLTPPTIALTVLYPLATKQAFDRHIWDLDAFTDPQRVVIARKYVLAAETIFCGATGLVKVSILLFYRRLSSRVVSRGFFWTTWVTIAFIIAYSVALTIAPIVGCQPVEAFWEQFNPIKRLQGYEFHCFDEGADVLAASIISVTQDLLTAIMPTFLYWNLQIPLRQKLALFGIFAMGYGVVALGALRAYYSWYTFYDTYDITWATYDLFLTSLLELHIGCLCANAPALKVFFKHFFQEKLTSRSPTKTPVDSKDRASPNGSSKPSKSSLWSKISSVLETENESGMRSTRGYLDSHAGMTVDSHGGVHVQKDMQVHHSPASSVPESPAERPVSSMTNDNIVDHYYDDIELGLYTTRNSGTSSVYSPRSFDNNTAPSTIPPLPTSPVFAAHEPLTAHPISPTVAEPPKSPVLPIPVVEKATFQRAPTPLPPPLSSHNRPSWQTWVLCCNAEWLRFLHYELPTRAQNKRERVLTTSSKQEGAGKNSLMTHLVQKPSLNPSLPLYPPHQILRYQSYSMSSTTTSLSQPTLYTSSTIKSTPTLSTALTTLINSAFYRSASSDPRWDTTIPRFDSPDELCKMVGDEQSTVAVIYSSSRKTKSEDAEGGQEEEGKEIVACAAAVPWKGGWHGEGSTCESGWEIKTVCVHESFVGRGLASRLVGFLGDHLCRMRACGSAQGKVTLWLLVADDLNGAYWRRRGWTEVRRRTEGPGVWGCKGEFDMVVLRREVCVYLV
ncbi:hypothetical protein J3E71DRAFT_189977 [Bipolaris maydis]|nr:hypothetical protein J3E71DRAFT_189977 [Bipolaris maydis]